MVFDTTPKYNLRTTKKCDIKAKEFRDLGNKQYNSKKRFDAFTTLRYYNMSIAYAESKEVAAVGYANRSAAYLEKEMYKECLENIQLARENNYPADKMAKLNEREEKCKKLMAEQDEFEDETPWTVFKLSHPANKKIPFIVDCVELKKTPNGNGIFATKDLKPGDVISVEESVVYFLRGDSYYERCFNCYKPNLLNLIPCDKTASIMFCSKECKENTYKNAIDMDKIMCDDVKLLSEIGAAYGSVKEFGKGLNCGKDFDQYTKTIFDYDWSNPEDPNYKKNQMMCVLSSAKEGDVCPRHIYSLDSNIKNNLPYLDIAEHIVHVLHSNNKLEPFLTNMHQGRRDFDFSRTNPCDPSIPLFATLIQRGRAGNVFSVLPGNKVVVTVMKPIKKGRQILFCENNHFELMGYGNNFDYMNKGLFTVTWDLLDDYNKVKKYFAREWKYITAGNRMPETDCYPTSCIEAFREMAACCSFPML